MRQKDLKTLVNEKVTHHESQEKSLMRTYLRTNKREDRDRLMKNTAKLEAYQEILALLS